LGDEIFGILRGSRPRSFAHGAAAGAVVPQIGAINDLIESKPL